MVSLQMVTQSTWLSLPYALLRRLSSWTGKIKIILISTNIEIICGIILVLTQLLLPHNINLSGLLWSAPSPSVSGGPDSVRLWFLLLAWGGGVGLGHLGVPWGWVSWGVRRWGCGLGLDGVLVTLGCCFSGGCMRCCWGCLCRRT